MRISPSWQELVAISAQARLARRRKSQGRLLSTTEAVAIVTDELAEALREGASQAELAQLAMAALRPHDLQPGVAESLEQLEVALPHGDTTVTVAIPRFASTGSPDTDTSDGRDGAISRAPSPSEIVIDVVNDSDRQVRVPAGYPFERADWSLLFNRELAQGYRLKLPRGNTATFAPRARRRVRLELIGTEAEPPPDQHDPW